MLRMDLRKELRYLYNPPTRFPVTIDVPPMNFLMIDGQGDPSSSQEFKDAIDALYSVANTLKFNARVGEAQIDYPVMPLEGLWATSNGPCFEVETDKSRWCWTLMIMQPDFITQANFEDAVRKIGQKKNLPALSAIRLDSNHEGLSVQVMHTGPLEAEGPAIEKLHDYIRQNNYRCRARLHEAYLCDILRAPPARLKTVLRQPIEYGTR